MESALSALQNLGELGALPFGYHLGYISLTGVIQWAGPLWSKKLEFLLVCRGLLEKLRFCAWSRTWALCPSPPNIGGASLSSFRSSGDTIRDRWNLRFIMPKGVFLGMKDDVASVGKFSLLPYTVPYYVPNSACDSLYSGGGECKCLVLGTWIAKLILLGDFYISLWSGLI